MNQVVITGISRGIGLELARQYLEAGWSVIGTHRSAKLGADLSSLQRSHRKSLRLLKLDVLDVTLCDAFAEFVGSEEVNLLINNAGLLGDWGRLGEWDEQTWIECFRVNTIGPLKVVEALRPNLKLSGNATVAMMSSRMGSMAECMEGQNYIYRSTKAALNAVGRSLAIDLQGDGIKVLMLHPGWVQTDMGGDTAPLDPRTSVEGLRKVISSRDSWETGSFLSFDGSTISW